MTPLTIFVSCTHIVIHTHTLYVSHMCRSRATHALPAHCTHAACTSTCVVHVLVPPTCCPHVARVLSTCCLCVANALPTCWQCATHMLPLCVAHVKPSADAPCHPCTARMFVHMLLVCRPHVVRMLHPYVPLTCCSHVAHVLRTCCPCVAHMSPMCCSHAVRMLSTCCPCVAHVLITSAHMLTMCCPCVAHMLPMCRSHAAHALPTC